MSVLNAIQDDYPSFIAEDLVDDWIAGCHSHLIQIGATLARLFIPSIISVAIFAMFMGLVLGNGDPMQFAGSFMLTFFLIMIFPIAISANTMSYYIKFRSREIHGAWIGVFTCECDGKWIKALDKDELDQCRGMQGKFIVKCPTCSKAAGLAGIKKVETCGNCKIGMNNQVKCRGCNRPLYLEKMYKKRLRDVDGKTIEKCKARFAGARNPAGKGGTAGEEKPESRGTIDRSKAWIRFD